MSLQIILMSSMIIIFFIESLYKLKYQFNKSRLHLINVNLDSLSFDKRIRCGRINNPLCEKIRSAGADVAGMHKR